jgi:hypothetical protein
MADSPAPRPPVPRLDRASLERVLARAAELQGAVSDADSAEQFTEEQLIDLGKEVGLSPQNLRQALAEERTRSIIPEGERGFAASLFGPSRVRAARTVPGKPTDVLGSIDTWMQKQETLIVKRHHADRIVWEPSRDFGVAIKRAFKPGGRDFALSRAFEVAATVMPVDETRVHVVLDGDFRTRRTSAAQQALGSAGFGGAVTGALFLMGITAVIAAAPVIVIGASGFATARGLQNRTVTRAQLALEQLLDRLERGDFGRRGSDSLLGAIVAAATQLPPRRY